MNRYRVILVREVDLVWQEVDARSKKEAKEKAYGLFNKIDSNESDRLEVELLEEEDE